MCEAFEAGDGRFEFMRGHADKGIFALFLELLLINIGTRAYPHCNIARLVTHGYGPAHVPPIYSIRAPETMFKVKRFTRVDGLLPESHIFFYIFGMNKLCPSPVLYLFKRETRELTPLRIKVIYVSVWTGR